ncbi:interleukin-1 receptor-associated kinase 4-like protein [Dinothrombium tinctorium]|uniref:non-specific serine/threonine protein kinase n=1 Tax=Dinothrombium tinctorium TaxID=1965070 RepID=A0A3S3PQ63_9ACAR|nr:interleukin-1 receptor-associated kinase 4-like protein [Dinothrombium tinctorium]RWS06073.1 interleukin-1 receptor-associated kinase 4-like protein [Dinothrombium tinctorium]
MQPITANTEIRHLRSRDRCHLSKILDAGDRWKDLAAIITKPDGEQGLLLTASNIRLLEQQKYIPNGSPTQALLDYWGTKGRKRPVIKDLIDYLIRSELYHAADYIAVNVLNGEAINKCGDGSLNGDNMLQSKLVNGASHFSLVNATTLSSDSLSNLNDDILPQKKSIKQTLFTPTAPNLSTLSIEDNSVCDDVSNILAAYSEIKRYSFSLISQSTKNFAEISVKDGGFKIGEGAFGSVYMSSLPSGEILAVKKLKNDFRNQFLNELKILTKFRHENLLPLLGIACEGTVLCLVYEFMVNGSLLDRIACVDDSSPIAWKNRMNITVKVCDGVCHLHSFDEKPYIHRDIKSANILLDKHLNPKVGDFGLARVGSQAENDITRTSAKTTNIIGTSVYMAPEAFRGDVSVKLDTFSFGVVMLELLTGLSPYDSDRDEPDLLSFVEERILGEFDENEITAEHLQPFIDPKAGQFDIELAFKYFKLSRLATEQRKKNRPTMVQLKELLKNLI